MDMNFCRRCGHALQKQSRGVFGCPNGHTIYANAAPAVGVLLVTADKQVVLAVRAVEPGKGKLDMAGGFCELGESFEDAAARELEEELGLPRESYGSMNYVMSHSEPYEFGGETNTVLGAIFWAELKPGADLTPADDVSGTEMVAAAEIDYDRLAFKGLELSLRLLIKQGVL